MKRRLAPLLAAFTLALAPPALGAPEADAPPAADAPSEADAARRIETMVLDLRQLSGPEPARIANVAQEMAAVGPAAAETLMDLLSDPEAAVREAAVRALGILAPESATGPLIARLGDESPAVAAAAVAAVSRYPGEWPTEALVRWLGHPDAGVRKAVLGALGERDGRVVQRIARRLVTSPPKDVGPGPYLVALGRFPDRTTEKDLLRALEDPALAPFALRGLAELGPKAAKALARALPKLDPAVAAPAVDVLVGYGAPGDAALDKVLASLSPELEARAVAAWIAHDEDGGRARLAALAGHKDPKVRVAALERVVDVGDVDLSATLADNLRHRDAAVRVAAARAVRGAKAGEKVAGVVIDRYRILAQRRTPETAAERSALLRAMGEAGGDSAVSELVQAIGHDDEVEAALDGLGSIGEAAVGTLLFVIKTGDPVRTPLAVRALGAAGPAAVAPLLDLLRHPSRDVRNTARRALADMGDPSVVPALVTLVQDKATPGRAQIIALFGALWCPASFEALRALALEDEDYDNRKAAVLVLGQQDDPQVLPVLREAAAKDDNNEVRHTAVKGLIWQGDADAVPLLIKMLGYEREFIRKTAAFGVGYLGSPSDVPKIVPHLSTPRDDVLSAVRGALRRITFRPDLDKPEQFTEWAKRWKERKASIKPLEASDMTLADGTVLRFWMAGQGRPLLVLHDGPDLSHDYLRPAVDRLMDRHLVVYVDLPGRGQSTSAPGATLGVENDVASVASMLARLNLREVDVLGHGWGAMVAARLADKHPRLVRRVVLDNSPVPTLQGWAARFTFVDRVPEPWRSDLITFNEEAPRFRPKVRDRWLNLALLTGALQSVRALAEVKPRFHTDPALRERILLDMVDFDLRPVYERIEKTTLLLYGDGSPLDDEGRAWRDRIAADNPQVRLKIVPGSGHLPFYENADRWYEAVDDFLL